MYFPYLRYGCNFEINSARTAAYVQNRCEFCGDLKAHMDVRIDCPVLGWELNEAGDDVIAASMTIPAADAPWVDASYPESARFMGFMITDVRKPSHVGRAVTPKISGFGGGILETLRAAAQEFEFEVLLFACDEAAMEFGFRYLVNGLVGGGCDEPCTLCDLEYRDSCHDDLGEGAPSLEEFHRGLWVLHNVGVTAAPEWIDPPVRGLDFYVRRAKFSLASELPWKFTCPETFLEDDEFDVATPTLACGADFEDFFCAQTAVLAPMVEPSIVGETGVIIELYAGTKTLSGITLEIIPDEYGWVADPAEAPPGFVNPVPCDLVYVADLPARHTLVYDTTIEQVYVRTNTGEVIDGTPFLSFDLGSPPGFPVVRCGQFAARVVVDECAVTASTKVTVKTAHREI